MSKANASINRKLQDFARSHKGLDGNGTAQGNTYQGTSAVRDIEAEDAEAARLAALRAAAARIP